MQIKCLLVFILVSIELVGCQPLPAAAIPTPQIWSIQRTPTLGWLSESMDSCARQQSNIGLIVDVLPAQSLTPGQAVFSLRWGAPSELKSAAAVVGYDDLVLIVNPKNPVTQLKIEDIRAIYREESSWKSFPTTGAAVEGQVKPWTYPDGQDAQQIFQQLFNQEMRPNVLAGYAPDSAAMRQAVAADVNALGYLPRRWLDSTIRPIGLSGANPDLIHQPILALYSQPPLPEQKAWLVCLQTKIFPGK